VALSPSRAHRCAAIAQWLWFGQSFLTQVGTILAVGICICGLALNFFTEPWIWLVLFLLLSPLSGGLYAFSVTAFHSPSNTINWSTYSAYFLLTPLAGILYGLFGPTKRRDEEMNPSFTKRLILTVWFLGAGLFVFGFGAPMITYIGLAWALASGILAAAQAIRLKQTEWLGTMVGISVGSIGLALFFWGFIYGAFSPTAEK
jgi:hypothetical protein